MSPTLTVRLDASPNSATGYSRPWNDNRLDSMLSSSSAPESFCLTLVIVPAGSIGSCTTKPLACPAVPVAVYQLLYQSVPLAPCISTRNCQLVPFRVGEYQVNDTFGDWPTASRMPVLVSPTSRAHRSTLLTTGAPPLGVPIVLLTVMVLLNPSVPVSLQTAVNADGSTGGV